MALISARVSTIVEKGVKIVGAVHNPFLGLLKLEKKMSLALQLIISFFCDSAYFEVQLTCIAALIAL